VRKESSGKKEERREERSGVHGEKQGQVQKGREARTEASGNFFAAFGLPAANRFLSPRPCKIQQPDAHDKNLARTGSAVISPRPSLVFNSPVAPSSRTRVGMPVMPYFSDNFDFASRSEKGSASQGISL
jgi:hypothetical protein